jgi:hypothetical protein
MIIEKVFGNNKWKVNDIIYSKNALKTEPTKNRIMIKYYLLIKDKKFGQKKDS